MLYYLFGCVIMKAIIDTHRRNTPSSKNPALTKFMKIDIWVIDALSRPFLRGSHTQTKFLRNKLLVAKLRSF